ncbi:MAG: hypothetical protein K6F75_09010 [Butyrivibrio sp.]|nr:hypothetical protein [Butyrivibrio sp.]
MTPAINRINVKNENGLYTVDDYEIDSLEELERAVLRQEGDEFIVTCNQKALPLVLELAGDLSEVYGKKISIPMEDTEEDKTDNIRYFAVMKNGYDAFVSGVYPQQISNTYAKHVLVHDKEADLRSYVDINSAIFTRKETHNMQPPYSHKHVIGKGKISFDNSGVVLKRTVLAYSDYIEIRDRGQLVRGHEYILKLKSPEDYSAFENDLFLFEKTGFTDTYERRLIDECRWSNGCSLKRMLRFWEKNGRIYPCLSSKESIGRLGDDYDDIIRSANRKCDRAIIDRKCMSCTAHDRCSGCAMLPKGLSKNDFCDFMRSHRLIGEFIVRQHVAAFLAQFSNLFRDDEYIHFLVPGKKFSHTGEEVGKQDILCEKDGQYFYLNTETGSLMKVR